MKLIQNNKMYSVVEEASGAVVCYTDTLQEAIEEAKSKEGKYLVFDGDDNLQFDSNTEISYKI